MCIDLYKKENRLLEIYQDEYAISPRKDRDRDNLSIITSFKNSNSFIADNQDLGNLEFCSWEEFKQYMEDEFKAIIIFPLRVWFGSDYNSYSIDPDSETITYNRCSSLDYGGVIYTTKERVEQLYGSDPKYYSEAFLKNAFESELKEYNQYCAGDIYGYKLFEVETCKCCGQEIKKEIDSCWGFYGSDFKKSGLFDSANW